MAQSDLLAAPGSTNDLREPRPLAGPAGAMLPVEWAFRAGAAARRARAFHPRGRCHAATVSVPSASRALGALAGEHAAVVRLSRGVGLPEALPDVLGLALRVDAPEAEAGVVDLLLASSGPGAIGRHTLRVRRGLGPVGWYSTIARFRAGSERLVVGAHADGPRRPVQLLDAVGSGPWQPAGTLEIGEPLDPAGGDCDLRFDPWCAPPGLEVAEPFDRLRAAAYRGSRAGA